MLIEDTIPLTWPRNHFLPKVKIKCREYVLNEPVYPLDYFW